MMLCFFYPAGRGPFEILLDMCGFLDIFHCVVTLFLANIWCSRGGKDSVGPDSGC